jgi:anhydro-N-acetylmuramic acid kinase
MTIHRAIGLMSGTSMDGIDVALIETDGETVVRRGPAREFAYEAAFRRRIEASLETAKQITERSGRPGDLRALEQDITRRHAEAVRRFMAETSESADAIDVIGFHGQTVLHRPEKALTVQIGDGQLLADITGIKVVYDLRANDMAHGGQGAPLVPVYHQALAAGQNGEGITAFVNIGGIANVTFVGGGDPVAFDTGPGNALIDQWVQRNAGIPFDDGGRIASEGAVDDARVTAFLDHDYFRRKLPKSLDRNDFSPDLVAGMELSDGARTLAAMTARSILGSAIHAPGKISRWIICGGGRRNAAIMAELAAGAKQSEVVSAEDAGFDGGAMEAEAWAYLAVRSLKGLPITFPQTTGVKEAVTGGVLCHPQTKAV